MYFYVYIPILYIDGPVFTEGSGIVSKTVMVETCQCQWQPSSNS